MKIPDDPQTGKAVKDFAKEVVKWMKANEIRNVFGGKLKKSPNGVSIEIPKSKRTNTENPENDPESHPWKVSQGASGAFVNAGFAHYYYMTYANASGSEGPDGFAGPDTIVAGPAIFYNGGSVSVTGTQYIYAEMTQNLATDCYCQADGSADVVVVTKLINKISPPAWVDGDLAEEAVLVASDDSPDIYTPTSGYVARCIARVTNTDGVITVNKQYITHNFDMFLPVVQNIVTNNA